MRSVIIFCAEYVYLVTLIGWAVTLQNLPHRKRLQFVAISAATGLLAFLLALLASHLHYEPRPFMVQHVRPLVAHGTDNGFPSDHALLTMTLTAIVWFYSKRIAVVMAVATVLVGIGRVGALLHSPQQIAAGWLIAVLAATTVHYIWYGLRSRRTAAH